MEGKGFLIHLIKVVKVVNTMERWLGWSKEKCFINTDFGARQGCRPLSHGLFNFYLDELAVLWEKQLPLGMMVADGEYLCSLNFAKDTIIHIEREDQLQIYVL